MELHLHSVIYLHGVIIKLRENFLHFTSFPEDWEKGRTTDTTGFEEPQFSSIQ
jgi:hypothetical protein